MARETDRPETDEPPRYTRYFTPDEANAVLPVVIGHMARIADRVQHARRLAEDVRGGEADEEAMRRLDEVRVEIEGLVDAIHGQGAEVKGLSPGLVDFPALKNGVEVYLCWREGEDRIEWWHPLHTGVAGRQRIADAPASWEWCN